MTPLPFSVHTVPMDTLMTEKDGVDREFALRSIARETYPDGTPRYHGLVVDGVIVVIDMAPWRFEPEQAPGVPLCYLVDINAA